MSRFARPLNIVSALFLAAAVVSCSQAGESMYGLYPAPAVNIKAWCPADKETDISVNSQLWIQFDGPMNAATLNIYTFLLGSGREHVRGGIVYDPNLNAVYYRPYEGLRPNGTYDLYLTDGAKDVWGRAAVDNWKAVRFTVGANGSVVCPLNPNDEVIGREYEEEEESDFEDEGAEAEAADVESDGGDEDASEDVLQ